MAVHALRARFSGTRHLGAAQRQSQYVDRRCKTLASAPFVAATVRPFHVATLPQSHSRPSDPVTAACQRGQR